MAVSRSAISGSGLLGRMSMLGVFGVMVSIGVAGCSSALTPAPITDQSTGTVTTASATEPSGVVVTPLGTPSAGPVMTPPAGPGFYRVKPGDTLYGIARAQKQKPSDLIKWNSLPASLQVNIDQLLRVAPPGAPGTAPSVDQWSQSAETKTAPPIIGGGTTAPAAAASGATNATNEAPPSVSVKGAWLAWPAEGSIIGKFGDGGSKGIDIGGKLGEPVKAAAAGRVVYAGTGLRAYGPMIIVKHSNDYLTAYAHNSKLLVKEGDTVRQGAVIAEMGTGQNDKPLLHFELRKSGQAVDPVPSMRKGG